MSHYFTSQTDQLTHIRLTYTYSIVPYSCIYGYEAPTHKATGDNDKNKVIVHYVTFSGPDLRNPSAAKRTTAQFMFERTEDADRFIQTARDLGGNRVEL